MSTLQGVKLSELSEITTIPNDAYLYVVTGTPLTGYKIKKENLIKSIYEALQELEEDINKVESSTFFDKETGIKYTRVNDQWVEL